MAQFVASLAMLMLGVGFGGFYLAKQLGWFGLEPLHLEALTVQPPPGGRPLSRWSRYRRLLTAVLLMLLGVLSFAGVNWLNPREHLRGSLYFLGGLILLCLVTMVLAWQDLRELRRLTRSLRTLSRPGAVPRERVRRFGEPGGDGDGESPGGTEGEGASR
jgi:hypothetical protein